MGDALLNQELHHRGKDRFVIKRIAAAIAGLLIATPSTFANAEEANMFQDLGTIKATCIYD